MYEGYEIDSRKNWIYENFSSDYDNVRNAYTWFIVKQRLDTPYKTCAVNRTQLHDMANQIFYENNFWDNIAFVFFKHDICKRWTSHLMVIDVLIEDYVLLRFPKKYPFTFTLVKLWLCREINLQTKTSTLWDS